MCVINVNYACLYSHFLITSPESSRFTNIFLRFYESMLHFPIDKNFKMLYNNIRIQGKRTP